MKNIKKLLISIAVCLSVATNVVYLAACNVAGGGQSENTESVNSSQSSESEVSESSEESEISESSEDESEASEETVDSSSSETEEDEPKIAHAHVWTEGVCEVCDLELIRREDKYVYFGEYPQTLKAGDVQVADEVSENGYFAGDDGAYYAMVVATPYTFEYVFSTGDAVTYGETYYFKVEPIRWLILEENNETGEAKLLCDSILTAMAYQDDYYFDNATNSYYTTANGAPRNTYANNYKYSKVRNWLNSEFYNTAFDEMQRSLLETMLVDNSAATTMKDYNMFACGNTNDKVTLLSFKDTVNTAYGFQKYSNYEDVLRVRKTTDFARAIGAWTSTSGRFTGNGSWMLRSPHPEESSHVTQGERSGKTNVSVHADIADSGVAPVITIKL